MLMLVVFAEKVDAGGDFGLHFGEEEANIISQRIYKYRARNNWRLRGHVIRLHLHLLLRIVLIRLFRLSLYLIHQLEHIVLADKILIPKVKNIKAKLKEARSVDHLALPRHFDWNRLDQRVVEYLNVRREVKHAHTFYVVLQVIHDLLRNRLLISLINMAPDNSSRNLLGSEFEISLVHELLRQRILLAFGRPLPTVVILPAFRNTGELLLRLPLRRRPLLVLDLRLDGEPREQFDEFVVLFYVLFEHLFFALAELIPELDHFLRLRLVRALRRILDSRLGPAALRLSIVAGKLILVRVCRMLTITAAALSLLSVPFVHLYLRLARLLALGGAQRRSNLTLPALALLPRN